MKDVRAIRDDELTIPSTRQDNISPLEEPLDMEPQEVATATWELKKHLGSLNFEEREEIFSEKYPTVLQRGQPDPQGVKWNFTNPIIGIIENSHDG